jgi:hypothetical protein
MNSNIIKLKQVLKYLEINLKLYEENKENDKLKDCWHDSAVIAGHTKFAIIAINEVLKDFTK